MLFFLLVAIIFLFSFLSILYRA